MGKFDIVSVSQSGPIWAGRCAVHRKVLSDKVCNKKDILRAEQKLRGMWIKRVKALQEAGLTAFRNGNCFSFGCAPFGVYTKAPMKQCMQTFCPYCHCRVVARVYSTLLHLSKRVEGARLFRLSVRYPGNPGAKVSDSEGLRGDADYLADNYLNRNILHRYEVERLLPVGSFVYLNFDIHQGKLVLKRNVIGIVDPGCDDRFSTLESWGQIKRSGVFARYDRFQVKRLMEYTSEALAMPRTWKELKAEDYAHTLNLFRGKCTLRVYGKARGVKIDFESGPEPQPAQESGRVEDVSFVRSPTQTSTPEARS